MFELDGYEFLKSFGKAKYFCLENLEKNVQNQTFEKLSKFLFVELSESCQHGVFESC